MIFASLRKYLLLRESFWANFYLNNSAALFIPSPNVKVASLITGLRKMSPPSSKDLLILVSAIKVIVQEFVLIVDFVVMTLRGKSN